MDDTEQSVDEIRAHMAGPVAAAWKWLDAVVRWGDYEAGWVLTDLNLRMTRAQAWLWNNRNHPLFENEDLDGLAVGLATKWQDEPLWESFAEIEVNNYRSTWARWDLDALGAASRPRVVGVDYEVVVFARATGEVYGEDTLIPALQFLMHFVDGQWLVAHPGDVVAPVQGWPPRFSD